MYLAEWTFGANTESTNPIIDYDIIYALSLIVVAKAVHATRWEDCQPNRRSFDTVAEDQGVELPAQTVQLTFL
jgi:hypothetical protein